MAIVISAGAGLVLGHLGETMVDLSGRDIPRLAASLQLSAQSASLASQGPALLAARSEEALNERAKKMKETQTVALQKLGEIIELGADKTVVAALTETVKNIDDMIKSLGSAARERLELAAQHEKHYDALRKAQTALRRRRRPRDDGRPDRDSTHPTLAANLSQDDATEAARDGRAARQRHRQQQSDGLRHDRRRCRPTTATRSKRSRRNSRTAQARVKSNLELLPKTPATQGAVRSRA